YYFAQTGSVFTIHNIGYQGDYPAEWYPEIGVAGVESLVIKSGKLNFMAIAPGVIKHLGPEGSYINTVSNTYADQIRRGFAVVDRELEDIKNRFGGILNGIDFSVWNPKTDKAITANYEINDGIDKVKEARAVNKKVLQEFLSETGDISTLGIDPLKKRGVLKIDSNRPLAGIVSRLVGQKQIDILFQIIEDIYAGRRQKLDMDLVILGTGEEWLEEMLAKYADIYSDGSNMVYIRAYNDKLSRMIYSGADMVLVPSDYEPSGLTQMIAMRYGAIPVVRKTGGLADTVFELGSNWTGFVFDGVSRILADANEDGIRRVTNASQLYATLERAVSVYKEKATWNSIIINAMQANNRWSRSIGYYMNVYAWLRDELSHDSPAFDEEIKDKEGKTQAIIVRKNERGVTSSELPMQLRVVDLEEGQDFSANNSLQEAIYVERGSIDILVKGAASYIELRAGDLISTFASYNIIAMEASTITIVNQTSSLSYRDIRKERITEFMAGGKAVPEIIRHLDTEEDIALVLRRDVEFEKFRVVTLPDNALNIGTKSPKQGERDRPHIETPIEKPRETMIFMVRGKANCYLYTTKGEYIGEPVLEAGDKIILLAGHKVEFIGKDNKMIEVAEGPYPGPDKAKIFLDDQPPTGKDAESIQLKKVIYNITRNGEDCLLEAVKLEANIYKGIGADILIQEELNSRMYSDG
ncbi:MAG: glycosyltransferase, partial [Candidatus Omnitrophica bacterium]|nr:glycosyltransferase [Candidatus Omnitrophota bacterium]